MNFNIETIYKNPDKSFSLEQIRKIKTELEAFFEDEFKKFSQIELSLLISDDDFIQNLNKEYRGKDKATNTLSFPSNNKNLAEIDDKEIYLGDIVISSETIKNEAKEQEKDLLSHYSHIFIHSILHLMGYDHINEKDAQIMENIEVKLLSKLNISNPY